MDSLVTDAHGYLEMVVMLISLRLEKYLMRHLFGFNRKFEEPTTLLDMSSIETYEEFVLR